MTSLTPYNFSCLFSELTYYVKFTALESVYLSSGKYFIFYPESIYDLKTKTKNTRKKPHKPHQTNKKLPQNPQKTQSNKNTPSQQNTKPQTSKI